jgi:hypothetical protein
VRDPGPAGGTGKPPFVLASVPSAIASDAAVSAAGGGVTLMLPTGTVRRSALLRGCGDSCPVYVGG